MSARHRTDIFFISDLTIPMKYSRSELLQNKNYTLNGSNKKSKIFIVS